MYILWSVIYLHAAAKFYKSILNFLSVAICSPHFPRGLTPFHCISSRILGRRLQAEWLGPGVCPDAWWVHVACLPLHHN